VEASIKELDEVALEQALARAVEAREAAAKVLEAAEKAVEAAARELAGAAPIHHPQGCTVLSGRGTPVGAPQPHQAAMRAWLLGMPAYCWPVPERTGKGHGRGLLDDYTT
jgi:hypothetical protein